MQNAQLALSQRGCQAAQQLPGVSLAEQGDLRGHDTSNCDNSSIFARNMRQICSSKTMDAPSNIVSWASTVWNTLQVSGMGVGALVHALLACLHALTYQLLRSIGGDNISYSRHQLDGLALLQLASYSGISHRLPP